MFILASGSPRRRDLLAQLGASFDVVVSGAPEDAQAGELPAAFARRVARDKALWLGPTSRWVLAADTVVAIDEQIFGKPTSSAHAVAMLQMLSNRVHNVLTAVALANPNGEIVEELLGDTRVEFRALSDEEVARYVASGEPMDKAGAYAIQGGAADFVKRVEGSHTNVIGLPIEETRELLLRHGLL